tara:strand:+ start:522 stop:821 length:300 start_codon:yes stop_codon:yes gene_type:complete
MTKYVSTILKVAVHRESVNPVFGEGNTYVSIDDECGGPFILIEQDSDGSSGGGTCTIRTDYEEFLAIAEAAKMLMHQLYIETSADFGGDAITEHKGTVA